MKLLRKQGFTLIEVIVVAAIIAVLAGIIVPLVFKEIDNAKISRAQGDIKTIQAALMVFKKDTGVWPVYNASCSDTDLTLLYGEGEMPGDLELGAFDQTNILTLSIPLSTHSSGCYKNWKGPYIPMITADPWGYAYIVNAKEFLSDPGPVWIISAGPNGKLETFVTATQLLGDDIGIRIK